MTRFKFIPLLLLLFLILVPAFLAACGSDDEQTVPSGAIAVVDGEEISKTKFDRLMAQAKDGYEKQEQEFPKQGTPEYATIKNNAVTYLVERTQFALAAEDMGVEVTDEEVDKRLNELKTQFFKGNDKRYQAALEEAGKTEDEVREDVRDRIVQEKVAERLAEDIQVSDEEIQKHYNENKSQFGTPESREVRHILVSCKNDKECAKARDEAQDLRSELQNGADFAKLAKQSSDDPGSKETGGKLTVSKGATVPEFDKAAFSLPVNTLSQPIKTQFGFHLIEPLSATKPANTKPLKDVRATIRSQLVSQKRTEALTEWVKETKEKYGRKTTYQVGFQPPATNTQATTDQ